MISAQHYCQGKVFMTTDIMNSKQDGRLIQEHRNKSIKEECPTTEQDSKLKEQKKATYVINTYLQQGKASTLWLRHRHLQYAHCAIKKLPNIQLSYLQSHYWINDPFQLHCKARSNVIPII